VSWTSHDLILRSIAKRCVSKDGAQAPRSARLLRVRSIVSEEKR
jgi:hypothetical protein